MDTRGFHTITLGCKLNQAEIEQLGRQFLGAGHQLVGSLMEADLYVLNSCTVTHMAARDSRKLARRGQRLNPSLRTVLTGCYVDSDPDVDSDPHADSDPDPYADTDSNRRRLR